MAPKTRGRREAARGERVVTELRDRGSTGPTRRAGSPPLLRRAARHGSLCLTFALAVTPARAQTSAVALEVRSQLSPAACLDADALRRVVTQRLGRDPFAPGAPRRVEVEWRDTHPWRASVRVTEPDGSTVVRRLTVRGDDCVPLGEAVALAVTLAIDPDWAVATPPRADPSAAPPAPLPVEAPTPCRTEGPPVVTAAVCPSPTPPERPRPGLALRLALGGGAGLVGALGASAALEAEVTLHRLASVLVAARFTPARASDNGAVSVGLTRADLGACLRTDATLSLGGCAGLSVGALELGARAHLPVDAGARTWFAAWLDGRAELRVTGPFWLGVRVRAVVPFTRYHARVEGLPGLAHESAPVAAEGELSAGLRIP